MGIDGERRGIDFEWDSRGKDEPWTTSVTEMGTRVVDLITESLLWEGERLGLSLSTYHLSWSE